MSAVVVNKVDYYKFLIDSIDKDISNSSTDSDEREKRKNEKNRYIKLSDDLKNKHNLSQSVISLINELQNRFFLLLL
jgi:hypothetical protein